MAILDTLLLTAAVPVAKEAASAAVETISAASSGFAQLLRGEATKSHGSGGGDASEDFGSGDELVESFRSWLQANGIQGELNLDVLVQPGQPLSFSGKDAERIADHVASQPEWHNHFNQLAQQVAGALGGATQEPVTIRLSDSGWALSLGNSSSEA